jgi:hypothetical protein
MKLIHWIFHEWNGPKTIIGKKIDKRIAKSIS